MVTAFSQGVNQSSCGTDKVTSLINCHLATGRIGLGFVPGSGLERGALASSVAHDAHNLVVVGMSDDDMAFAVSHLAEIGVAADPLAALLERAHREVDSGLLPSCQLAVAREGRLAAFVAEFHRLRAEGDVERV